MHNQAVHSPATLPIRLPGSAFSKADEAKGSSIGSTTPASGDDGYRPEGEDGMERPGSSSSSSSDSSNSGEAGQEEDIHTGGSERVNFAGGERGGAAAVHAWYFC